MSALKEQTSTEKPEHARMTWPKLDLPEPDPRTGMTAEHQEQLHKWYASVQGAVNTRMDAMSKELESLRTKTTKS
jgi:hypothetical protein